MQNLRECLWCNRPTERRNYCNDKHMAKLAHLNYLLKARERDEEEWRKLPPVMVEPNSKLPNESLEGKRVTR